MKTKNYFLLFFAVCTATLSAQDLIIKRVYNESAFFSDEKNETF